MYVCMYVCAYPYMIYMYMNSCCASLYTQSGASNTSLAHPPHIPHSHTYPNISLICFFLRTPYFIFLCLPVPTGRTVAAAQHAQPQNPFRRKAAHPQRRVSPLARLASLEVYPALRAQRASIRYFSHTRALPQSRTTTCSLDRKYEIDRRGHTSLDLFRISGQVSTK